MKFIYTGQLPVKNADLARAGVFKPTDIITKGTIFEVPDDDAVLIQRVKCGGNYQEYQEPVKKVGRPKKFKKEEKIDKEEK